MEMDDRSGHRVTSIERAVLVGEVSTESTPLLAIAHSTVAVDSPRAFGPEDLLAAWRR
jgi:hypothetical protein